MALPLLAAGGYYLWLRSGANAAAVQSSFLREMLQEGWSGTWWLTQRLTLVDLMYLGFFTLPIVAAVLPHAWRLLDGIPRRGWLLFAVWQALLLIGVTALWVSKVRMPYIPQFFGSGGLGPPDVLGSRPILIGPDLRSVLTVVCLVASLLLALVAARGIGAPPSLARSRAGLVLSIGLWQVVGVFPPSYHYIGWTAGSLDRYLLAPRAAGDCPRSVGSARGTHQPAARHDGRGRAGHLRRRRHAGLPRLHARGLGHG